MKFDLTDEQQELSSFLRNLLGQRAHSAQARATIDSEASFDVELWGVMCEQIGVASLAIPEEYGGAGFTTRETHLVLEELGRTFAPSPFLGSVAIAAQAIIESGNAEAAGRLLPEIAAGEAIATLAWAAPDGRWAPARVGVTAELAGADAAASAASAASAAAAWRLSGQVPSVLDGIAAQIVLAIAQTPAGPALFAVEDTSAASVTREHTPTLDQTLELATLTFTGATATLLSDDAEVIERVRLHALTAITALQVGTAARALEETVEYSKQRTQFGRQIGSFQALKHRMAELHVLLETARTTSAAAAWAEAEHDAQWAQLAPLAKVTASDALTQIASEMIQLHGGIAITWEHDAHLVFKRAHATAQLFGSPAELRALRAVELGLAV
ncbi:alkylation response protein AidB-like acyl-CoA dehydrogenase [Leucobacter exalbidus]|uniref:Alkylation response protein AidB-like acyl-CoA dehydrogenase n=1 Tax=Leucobacter exalbidus TaxID=662960 RepID=A0A940PL74_9MICO|nr:acyl-CoA dehydrogenase family protein [Leucobacter exalbidus]MBP1325972.1 alkylation response protein AidB-like acyl-CoA dehydrogenase [Leucobacter exalbidus]